MSCKPFFLSAVLLGTAQAFSVPAIGSLRSAPRRTADLACMAVPYDKTKEGDYPHPHDDDYKFGGSRVPCTRGMPVPGA